MSGLAAIFNRDGRPSNLAALEPMLAAIAHRALDGCWGHQFSNVALGYAKAAVTQEEIREQQPLVSPRTGCAIVADVRLDNREQLLSELGQSTSVTASDAELILRAYEQWDSDAPRHLLGDFAFVIWDPRRGRLLCARDVSGGRPLYYRYDERSFAGASEIQQLLQDPAVRMAPSEERIRDWLVPSRVYCNEQEQASTFFEGIFLLPAGHVLVIDGRSSRLDRYWEMPVVSELRYRKPQQYVQHFADLLVTAVTARLRTVHPVAAALSGGMDSTSIVSLAHVLFERGLAENHGFITYSMLFDDPEADESPYIRDVQSRYGFDARGYRPMGIVSNFDPQPGGFMAAPMKATGELDPVMAMAGESGARTLLTGHYGDNCFGAANRSLDSLLRRGQWAELLRQLHAFRDMSGQSLRRSMGLYCLLPLVPMAVQRQLWSAVIRREFDRDRDGLLPGWIPEAFANKLLERDLDQRLQDARARRFASEEREQIFRSLYPPEVFATAAASSVQVVRPFADRRLHEFMLAVPPEQLFQPHPYVSGFTAGNKLILRRAMLGILPESVRTRVSKTQFRALVLDEIQRRWSEYAAAFGPGQKPEVVARGYVEPNRFWQQLERMHSGEFGTDGLYVLRILNLETWLRTLRLPRNLHAKARAATGAEYGETKRAALMTPRLPTHAAPQSRGALVGAG